MEEVIDEAVRMTGREEDEMEEVRGEAVWKAGGEEGKEMEEEDRHEAGGKQCR